MTEAALRAAILDADAIVVRAMRGYLRTCRSGGMPRELADKVEASVADAAELGCFRLALAEAAKRGPAG